MDWNEEELQNLEAARADENSEYHSRPPRSKLLSPFTVSCMVFNRTIGSGIFVAPFVVYESTRSVGVSLIFWLVGGIISTCGLLVWLELGMSVPKVRRRNMLFWVPRNGGEKNFLEFIYSRYLRATTSIYGMAFIIIGNLSGNAIAMGSYIMIAAGRSPDDNAAKGIAIVALTLACLLHGVWRAGGIWVNNGLAVLKVLLLLSLFILGLCAANKNKFVRTHTASTNFDTHRSFSGQSGDAASYIDCLVYILYSFSGYEQPFYVIGDVRKGEEVFAPTMLATMGVAVCLFMAVATAYFCAWVPGSPGPDMATAFLKFIFGTEAARRVMAGIISVCIFGNIVVFTFTAGRVKQQIAMEGILPFWKLLSSDSMTPVAKLALWFSRGTQQRDLDNEEKSPIAALALHCFFSCLLVGLTAGLPPRRAAIILINLYSYVIILVVGLFVSLGLIYVRLWRERTTWTEELGFHTWGGPTAAIIYAASCTTFLISAFLPIRDPTSPFSEAKAQYKHFIIPTVGWCSILLGLIYLAGLESYLWHIGQRLFTSRRVFIEEQERGHYVYGESIKVEHRPRNPIDEITGAPEIPMTVLQT